MLAVDEEWVIVDAVLSSLEVLVACRFSGGIFMGDSSLYLLGSGRRYDFRMGLESFSLEVGSVMPQAECSNFSPNDKFFTLVFSKILAP